MPLIRAQCPNCGAALDVDKEKEAAVCPFCNTPYIVEKAIQNITNNNKFYINNATFNNQESEESYLKRGLTFIDLRDGQKAYDLFTEFATKYPQNYKTLIDLQDDVNCFSNRYL